MDQWCGKVAVVTGASSGIGAAVVLDLCRHGVRTVGLARRVDRIQQLCAALPANRQKLLHARRCDVASEADIVAAFAWIEEQFGGCDILVNNAGIVRKTAITDAANTAMLRETLDVNVMGVVLCTREAFRSMQRRGGGGGDGGSGGHVVLINSVAGHTVPYFAKTLGSLNVYQPSKHAITAMTEVLRQEFQMKNTRIKVTVSEGVRMKLCETACLSV